MFTIEATTSYVSPSSATLLCLATVRINIFYLVCTETGQRQKHWTFDLWEPHDRNKRRRSDNVTCLLVMQPTVHWEQGTPGWGTAGNKWFILNKSSNLHSWSIRYVCLYRYMCVWTCSCMSVLCMKYSLIFDYFTLIDANLWASFMKPVQSGGFWQIRKISANWFLIQKCT